MRYGRKTGLVGLRQASKSKIGVAGLGTRFLLGRGRTKRFSEPLKCMQISVGEFCSDPSNGFLLRGLQVRILLGSPMISMT
jgi:hypothetical protein